MSRAGWILGTLGVALGLELAFAGKAHATPRRPTPPSPDPGAGGSPSLYPSGIPMADPGYTYATWQPIVRHLIATEFPRVPEAYAKKWGDMESDWNPCAVGDPGQLGDGGSSEPAEMGLGQLYNPDDFHRYGIDPARFRAYAPAAAPLAAAYRQAKADRDAARTRNDAAATLAAQTRMNGIAHLMQTRTRALTASEMDDQVRCTLLRKIADGMATADGVVHVYGLTGWPIVDYWKLVKAPHALPAILGNGMPAVVKKLGRAPSSWHEFRTALGMDGHDQWRRALDACEACGNAMAPAVA